jgi:nitrite reductase (NADH) small subunit/3-phenylpropionate/trans-cinnamate dioxygenase ferredoxin subunit
MADFKTVANVGDIPDGQGIAYAVNGRMVAVFIQGGVYEAIDDFCPHMGASLAGGHVEDGVVFCPWHAWRFKTCDGTWCDNPTIGIDHSAVRVDGAEIQVCVPDKKPPNAGVTPSEPEAPVDDAP